MRSRLALLVVWALLLAVKPTIAQGPAAGAPVTDLPAAIGRLGSLDYPTRMNAARQIRRAPSEEAVPALIAAVKESPDQFVRYRGLVLLTGFIDRRTAEVMRAATTDRNDRMREVAYRWLATRPQEASVPQLLASLQSEQAEFVRPALVRALAASADDPLVQSALVGEVARGQDFFRLGVIDALGEFKAVYARDALVAVANIEGPLQDDAILALGRIGDRRSLTELQAISSSATEVTTALQAALCLLEGACDTRIQTIVDVISAPGSRPPAVAGAVTVLAVLGATSVDGALATLLELSGIERTRDSTSVGFGGAALRNPERVLTWQLGMPSQQQNAAVEVLHSAFERFEDDFAEEQFFAAARAAYWRAADGSADRTLMASLIQRLEF